MDRQIITFRADDQVLVKLTGADLFASNIVSYIDAQFDLGTNWGGFDAVRAVWQSNAKKVATVLDSNGNCVVPAEMLRYPSRVTVNLVGSVAEGTVLKERLTTYPVLAFTIDKDVNILSDVDYEGTPTLFEQYVGEVGEMIEHDVDAWLTAHPEYITTVVDDSLTTPKYKDGSITTAKIADRAITEAKLSSALKLKTLKDYVTPEMFGAKGDNETDDTVAVQAAIDCSGTTGMIVFLRSMYRVSALKLNYNYIAICGSGEKTGFSALDDSNIFTTDNQSCADFTFRDFLMDGRGLGGKAFNSENSHRLSSYLIDNLTIRNFDVALDIISWVSNITNCWFEGNNTAIKLHGCNALKIDGCSFFGFEDSEDGIGIKTTGYCTTINIVNNTFQHLGGAILIDGGSAYTISGNYFEYNDSDEYPVILLDASSSHDLKDVIVQGNYIMPTAASTEQVAIMCKYVYDLFIGVNRIGTGFTHWVDIDSDCQGSHLVDPLTPRLSCASRQVSALRTSYVEGIDSNPANTDFAMAYDRYRYKPIWWIGSKWIFADGSDRT